MRSSASSRRLNLDRVALPNRPLPFTDLLLIDPVFVRVGYCLDDLPLQPADGVRSLFLQPGHLLNHVDCQVEAIHLVEDRQLQRSIDVALLRGTSSGGGSRTD
jgi:hypothetical protein